MCMNHEGDDAPVLSFNMYVLLLLDNSFFRNYTLLVDNFNYIKQYDIFRGI